MSCQALRWWVRAHRRAESSTAGSSPRQRTRLSSYDAKEARRVSVIGSGAAVLAYVNQRAGTDSTTFSLRAVSHLRGALDIAFKHRYFGGSGRSPHPAGLVGAIDAATKFERWTLDKLDKPYKEDREVAPLSMDGSLMSLRKRSLPSLRRWVSSAARPKRAADRPRRALLSSIPPSTRRRGVR